MSCPPYKNVIAGLKFCPQCREFKRHDDFYREATRHDGLSGWCRSCKSARNAPRARIASWHQRHDPDKREAFLRREREKYARTYRSTRRDAA
jgi:hypothetical protein